MTRFSIWNSRNAWKLSHIPCTTKTWLTQQLHNAQQLRHIYHLNTLSQNSPRSYLFENHMQEGDKDGTEVGWVDDESQRNKKPGDRYVSGTQNPSKRPEHIWDPQWVPVSSLLGKRLQVKYWRMVTESLRSERNWATIERQCTKS